MARQHIAAMIGVWNVFFGVWDYLRNLPFFYVALMCAATVVNAHTFYQSWRQRRFWKHQTKFWRGYADWRGKI
jgi:hypothetical protein